MKATKKSVEPFLTPGKIAVAGVSRNRKKFGYMLYDLLKKQGYQVFPVNPNTNGIDDEICYPDIRSLPPDIRHLVVATPKARSKEVISAAVDHGMEHFWIQRESQDPEAVALLQERKLNVVTGECLFMHIEPVTGVHRFHRALRRFFGGMPE